MRDIQADIQVTLSSLASAFACGASTESSHIRNVDTAHQLQVATCVCIYCGRGTYRSPDVHWLRATCMSESQKADSCRCVLVSTVYRGNRSVFLQAQPQGAENKKQSTGQDLYQDQVTMIKWRAMHRIEMCRCR